MKRTIILMCLFLFKLTCANKEEIQNEEYDVQLEDDEYNNSFPPITINITVSNVIDAHSNNQVKVLQNQTLIQESKNENHKSSWDISHIALLALLATTIQDDSSNCWENGW